MNFGVYFPKWINDELLAQETVAFLEIIVCTTWMILKWCYFASG